MRLLALKAIYCLGFNLYHACPNILEELDYSERTKVYLALDEIREMTSAYKETNCSIKLVPAFTT